MKIHLDKKLYNLDSIEELSNSYPNYQGLVRFILNWIRGDETFIFHTSGSTGTAKETNVSRNQIITSVSATQKKLKLNNKESALLCLNPDFVASKMMAARAVSIDMDLIIVPPTSSPLKLLQMPTGFASFVPFQIYQMIKDGSISELGKIRNVLIGGAPLDPWAIKILSAYDNNIYITYGMTETVSHIALKKITGQNKTDFYTVLDNLAVKVDDRSCLCIDGAVTNHQLIITNDVVTLKGNYTFEWLGRHDNIINSGGIKINPEKIEYLIASLITDKNFFIASIPDQDLGQKCILIVESKFDSNDFLLIQKELSNSLSKHYIPKEGYSLDSFIYTDSGKLKRKDTLALITK